MFLWLFYFKLEKEVEETVLGGGGGVRWLRFGKLGFQKVLVSERIWIQIMVRKGKNERLL